MRVRMLALRAQLSAVRGACRVSRDRVGLFATMLVTHTVTDQSTTHLRLTALAGLAGRRRAGKLTSSIECLFICGSKRSVCSLK